MILDLDIVRGVRSLIVRRSELAGAAVAPHHPVLVFVLLHQAGADELPHQAGSIVADLVVVLQLGDSLLHGVELGQLCLSVSLLLGLGFLVGLDLSQRPAPLRGDLQHVSGYALGH